RCGPAAPAGPCAGLGFGDELPGQDRRVVAVPDHDLLDPLPVVDEDGDHLPAAGGAVARFRSNADQSRLPATVASNWKNQARNTSLPVPSPSAYRRAR